jgi:hypothetical protein
VSTITAVFGFSVAIYIRGSNMAECEKLTKCPFFAGRISNMPSVAELMKKNYCLGDKTLCARYQLASAGLDVPMDLLPNDTQRVREILAGR